MSPVLELVRHGHFFDGSHPLAPLLVRVPLLVYAVAVIGYVLVEPGPVGGLI